MASSPRESLKQYVLLAFVVISVALVTLIWMDNLSDTQPGTTGFVRGTPVSTVFVATPVPSAIPATGTPVLTATPGDMLSGEE